MTPPADAPAALMSIAEMSQSLQAILGSRLTAVVAGVDDVATLQQSAQGRPAPREAAKRLVEAFEVVNTLLAVESPDTVRAWFAGQNPMLSDQAPALALASDPERVMRAARAFVANG